MAADGITLAFVGYADATAAQASAYEDAVLALLPDHGARVLARVRRRADQDVDLPHEVHLLWFPSRDALAAYTDDPRRLALLADHGDVFTLKQSIEVDVLPPPTTA